MTATASAIPGRAEQERSRDTRLRILDATVTALVEHGYDANTDPHLRQWENAAFALLL